jgi:hypothetical protein
MGLEPWFESRLINTSFIIPIRHPLEVANSLLQAEGTTLYKSLRLWIKSIFITEQATRGFKRKFISFDELIQNPANALETCILLVESGADPGQTDKIENFQNTGRTESISQATKFIDKSLRRQRTLIEGKSFLGTKESCNVRLIHLAEAVLQAVLDNITDDDAISSALDKLYPSMLRTSV